MTGVLAVLASSRGGVVLDAISFTAWSSVTDDFGAPAGASNEDRTLTWSIGGARNISCNYAGANTL